MHLYWTRNTDWHQIGTGSAKARASSDTAHFLLSIEQAEPNPNIPRFDTR